MAEQITPIETASLLRTPNRRLLASLALIAASANVLTSCANDEPHCDPVATHQMQLGETVWDLAARQNGNDPVDMEMEKFKSVNPGVNLGRVEIGQEINIPGNCD